MSSIRLTQVDAFASQPFTGNPAAVCLLPEPRSDSWMRNVAAEMNLSETAFLIRRPDAYDLRWFTPAVEVDLCGHATLASAHVLWEDGHLRLDDEARFHSRSGLLTARRLGGRIQLSFPADPAQETNAPAGLDDALGAHPLYVGRGRTDLLIQLESETVLRRLTPNFDRLGRIEARGLIVTAACADGEFDFVSRFFAPASGINEDPVTGSAHCTLGPFWRERLHRDRFRAYQASARGGVVHVEMVDDRVFLGGECVTVMRIELLVP